MDQQETSGRPESSAVSGDDVGIGARSFPLAARRPASPSFRRSAVECDVACDFSALVTSLAVALARHNEEQRIVIGCPYAGPEHMGIVSLRLELGAEATFGEIAESVRDEVERIGLLEGDDLVAELARPAPPCLVVALDVPNAGPSLVGREAAKRLRHALAAADVCLQLDGAAGVLRVEFDLELFTESTMRRIVDQLTSVSAHGAARPAWPVREFDLAGAEERAALLALATSTPSAETRCLHEILAEVARDQPNLVAVRCAGAELTYGELDRQAGQLAWRLRELGVGRGDRVGIRLGRSLELVVAMIGVLKAGAAYVPIDPDFPKARQIQIVDLAGVQLLLTSAATSPDLPSTSGEPSAPGRPSDPSGPSIPCEVVRLSPQGPEGTVAGDGPISGSEPSDTAYVMFTSGSTGRPKGVAVTHHSVARLFTNTREFFQFGPDDRWLNAHGCTFDASVWEIFGALLHGGRVVIVPLDVARDSAAMVALAHAERVSFLTISPTAFDGFRDAALERGEPFTALRFVVLCAEALNFAALTRWFDRWGDERPRLANMYGITETTVHSTLHELRARDARERRSIIGRGLPDTPVYVLDDRGRLAPFGVPGEIFVGGPGVARGYVAAAEADHARFSEDPYSPLPGARMYRSGDRARRLPDGSIEYLGRLDNQVKIRGHRIELAEIESVLLASPGVTAARAWVVRRENSPPALAAAVVTSRDFQGNPKRLRAVVAESLPHYMVPAGVVVVAELPRTPNGKLDVSRLPDPLSSTPAPDEDEPVLDIDEAVLSAVQDTMAETLGLSRLSRHANFFEHGGDSITAVRLVAKLRGAGFELQAAQIYELRTPLALARATTRIEPADHRAPALAAEYAPWLPRGAVAAFPATRLQRGMFLHSVLDGAHVFHDVLSYTVDHAIEENAFRAAVAQVVAANPVLRGSFLLDGPPEPLLVIHQHAKVDCEFVDLREIGAGDHADWLARWAAVERNAPLDWSAPGLLRFFVHRVSDGESVLSLSVHHAILDGWSVAMLVTELFIAYDRIRNDRPPGKKADHDILRRYAQLERAAERDRGHREFWREYLDGAKPSELPRDEGPGDSPAPAIGLRAVIPTDISQPLRRLARSAGVPLKTVYLAAHVASMAFLSGAPDVTAGLITNGRVEDEGGDRALGLFLNTVPLRVQLRDQTWPRLLKDVFANESLISRHRRFPFDRIQTDSHIAKLCPTAFNYTAFYVYRELDAIGLRPRDARYYEETDFPLLVNVDGDPFDETVTVTVNYKPHLVATRQAEFYLAVYTQLLEQAAAAPPEPIESAKPIESVAKSLAEWARTRRQTAEIEPGPAVRHVESVLTLVTAQIRRRPRDIAVEIAADEDTRRWTFEDLARRASRVRAGLRLASVEPNSRIACFTESGADALVALLGTWAAGGSYVPIDSGLPRARQRALLDAVPCSAVLRSPGIPADLVPSDGPELVLTAAEPPTVADVGTWPAPPPGSEAYVLFTSGSTGEPKAVSMSHGALANLIEWQIAQPEFAAPRRLSQLAPLSFDVSIQEMLAAAAAGGTLVIGRGLRRDPEATLAFLAERQIEICFLPPVLLHQLASAWEALRITPAALRYVITAGEALVVTDAIRALCAAAGAEIINQYGPTETHVVTSHRLGPRPEAWPDRPPIGRPINNVKVVILDTFGRRVPTAVSGELHIGGPAVARGYVDARGIHPMTAERFQKLAGDDIFYRTGDLVRVGHGVLEFAGRTDEQVKIRGYRVEPGEVAAVLSRHPGVRDCLVRAVESGRHGSVLAAYVVPTDARTTADQLVLHARATLPDYMLPQHIELLERFPTTPSGKVDVRALRPPRRPRPRPGTLTSATATERRVLAAWSHVLGYRVSSPNVSFFDAGGNSLLLLSLYLNLRQSFDQEFLMHDLFRFPTARSFAGFLDTDHSASSRREDPRLDAVSLSAEANRRRLARMRGRRDDARD